MARLRERPPHAADLPRPPPIPACRFTHRDHVSIRPSAAGAWLPHAHAVRASPRCPGIYQGSRNPSFEAIVAGPDLRGTVRHPHARPLLAIGLSESRSRCQRRLPPSERYAYATLTAVTGGNPESARRNDSPPSSVIQTVPSVMPTMNNVHIHIGYEGYVSWSVENHTRENVLDHLEREAFYGIGTAMTMGDQPADRLALLRVRVDAPDLTRDEMDRLTQQLRTEFQASTDVEQIDLVSSVSVPTGSNGGAVQAQVIGRLKKGKAADV